MLTNWRDACHCLVLALLAACGSGVSDPPADPGGNSTDPHGLSVSAPVPPPGSAPAGGATVAFVSAFPGTISRAATARVAVGTASVHAIQMLDGGFDPVPVPAEAGDEVRVEITDSAGSVSTINAGVKAGARPRVVRTSPAPRRTDVPLNAIIRVVFSAPMTQESVREGVRLTLAGARVPADVEAADGTGVAYDLVPVEELVPATEYVIEVSATVEDVVGMPMGEAVAAPFTTVSSSVPAAAGSIVLKNEYYTLEPEWEVAVGYETALYARALDGNRSPTNAEITFTNDQPGLVLFSVPERMGDGWYRLNIRGVGVGRATIVARAGDAVASAGLVVYGQVDLSTVLGGASIVGAQEMWTNGIVQSSEIFHADGSGRFSAPAHDADQWHRSPMTSSTGVIAFERAFMRGRVRDSVRVVIRFPDGWEQLVPTGGDQLCPSWSPDGSRLVFTEYYRAPDNRVMTTLVVIDRDGMVLSSWPAPAGLAERCAGWTLDGNNVGLFTLPAPDPRPTGIPYVSPSLAVLMAADSVRRFATYVWSLDEGRWLSSGSGPGVELYDGKRSRDGRWMLVVGGSTAIAVVSRDRTLRTELSISGVPRSPSFSY